MNVTPDQIPRLKQLWTAGLSAVEVGAELGLVGETSEVREAVLRAVEESSKPAPKAVRVVRSNLARPVAPRRARTPKPDQLEDEEADPRFKSDGNDGTPTEQDLAIPVEQRRSLLGAPHSVYPEIMPRQCKFPVGEPRSPEFFYCGAGVNGDECYCLSHCWRAYGGPRRRWPTAA